MITRILLNACTAAALMGGVVASATEPARPLPPQQGPAAAKPNVTAATPVASDPREIRAQLAPRRYTTLAAEIGAKINSIAVPEGASFRAGQTLVQFDCGMQRAQADKARATLDGAEKAYGANKRLAELNSVGKMELEMSEAEVRKQRAEVNSMHALLGKCAVAAPFAGRVAEQKVREQQYVQPGQAMLDIIDDSTLELDFLVPSRWLAWLKAGYPFSVAIDEVGKNYPAKVLRIGARVDPVSQSVKLVATIDGHFPELIAGMSGRVTLTPPQH
jgi:membrane fusion protein, multidrug efflux system